MNKKLFKEMLDKIVSPDFIETTVEVRPENSLTNIQAYQLAIALKQNPHITALDLSNDSIKPGIEDRGAIALAGVGTLKEINLSGNHITVIGATALAKGAFTNLVLSANDIYYKHNNHAEFQKMIDIFCNNKTIINLELSYSIIPDKMMAQLINKNNTIQSLTPGRDLGDKALEFISNNTALQELFIYDNKLTDQGAYYLSKNTSLEILRIGHLNINDNGVKVLTTHPSLQSLSLTDSNITTEGAKSFFSSNILKVNLFNAVKHDFISAAEIAEFRTNFYCFKQNQKTLDSKSSEEKQMEYTIDEDEPHLIGDNQDE